MRWGGAKQEWIDAEDSIATITDKCRERLIDEGVLSGDVADDRVTAGESIAGWLASSQVDAGIASAITSDIVNNLIGFGPLEGLMANPDISEIMVNGPSDVWIEANGQVEKTDVSFRDRQHVAVVLNRMLLGTGRRIDEGSPFVDATLADGSRLNAVCAPIAAAGPLLTIRRFGDRLFDLQALIKLDALDRKVAAFLHAAVLGRANILVSGGTGTGKTTFLAALAGLVPHDQRIVALEDVRELKVQHPHLVRQECRPEGLEGMAAVDLQHLVRNALRMRPDRLLVGEVRGGEAGAMVQAMNTGHTGSMSTLHANSAVDALDRLESMLAMCWPSITSAVLRKWIATALDLVVHCERIGGKRRVHSVVALDVVDGTPCARTVYSAQGDQFVPSGHIPRRCLERMAYHGVEFPPEMFSPR